MASGIRDVKEIVAIIPTENDKDKLMMVSLCFSLKKVGMTPRIVEIPAKKVIVKGKINLFIVNYIY